MGYGRGSASARKIKDTGSMESIEIQQRVAELLKEAEKQEKLSKEASRVSTELALMAADLRRRARLLKTKPPAK